MLFQKEGLLIRYVMEDDASIISKWLTDPAVLRYYEGRDNPQSVEKVLDHFIHSPNSNEKRCLIEFDTIPIGYIQMYPVDSSGKRYMAIKNHKMYGVWTNLSVNQPIGERELEQNSFRQQLHILWVKWEQKQLQWIRSK